MMPYCDLIERQQTRGVDGYIYDPGAPGAFRRIARFVQHRGTGEALAVPRDGLVLRCASSTNTGDPPCSGSHLFHQRAARGILKVLQTPLYRVQSRVLRQFIREGLLREQTGRTLRISTDRAVQSNCGPRRLQGVSVGIYPQLLGTRARKPHASPSFEHGHQRRAGTQNVGLAWLGRPDLQPTADIQIRRLAKGQYRVGARAAHRPHLYRTLRRTRDDGGIDRSVIGRLIRRRIHTGD